MIQIPFLKEKDISKIEASFLKEKYQKIPNLIEVTKEYINNQKINDITLKHNLKIERKAYIIECIINNDYFDQKKILFEQRLSRGPDWIYGYIDYLPKNFISFINRTYIKHPDDLETCRVAKNVIENYLIGTNVKCNLYGIGLIKSKIIFLKQLLVFEIVHFDNLQPKEKIDIRNLIPTDFTPIKNPFISG